MFGMQIGQMGQVGGFSLTRLIASMYQNGEQGAWYDPSDLSTLFQDTAGTVPVTAVEQAVALMLDKSGRGNHASQATSTKRFRYSRRVNSLTKTEQFDDAVWSPTNITPTLGQAGISGIAPVAVKLTPTTANGAHGFKAVFVSGRNGTTHSVYLKADGYNKVGFKESSTSGWFAAFDLNSATVLASTPGSLPTIQALAGGWCRISFSPVTVNAGQSFDIRVLPNSYVSGDTNGATFAGDGVSAVLMCGPQMEDGLTASTYQRVNTATDYDADPNKFPAYLACDGIDDGMQTGTIDFTGTDKMTVWAGVTKLSDTLSGALLELSSAPATMPGTFWINTSGSTVGDIWNGLASPGVVRTGYGFQAPAISTGVLSAAYDFAGTLRADEIKPRWNSTVPTLTGGLGADAGAGPFGNHPLYIGARAGTLLFFNGRIYQIIVRGAQSSLSQIEAAELYTRRRMMLP